MVAGRAIESAMATTSDGADSASKGVLSPLDRLTEALYGIILVLTFTGTVRVAAQGGDDPATTLWAAVGCSLAWGLVDASMYVFGSLTTRSRSFYLIRQLRADPEHGRQLLADALPAVVADALPRAERDAVVAALAKVPVPPRARVRRQDLEGAVGIFFLANAALLPLAVPFVLISDLRVAQHVSNGIALVLLFACGFALARYTGERPIRVALRLTGFGVVLIALTVALGG